MENHEETKVSLGTGNHMVGVTLLPVHGTLKLVADGNASWAALRSSVSDEDTTKVLARIKTENVTELATLEDVVLDPN